MLDTQARIFFVAGLGVLWRVLGMKAGQSKSMRVLGIIGIVAFIGFFLKNFEFFMAIMDHPEDFINAFSDHPIETTLIVIASLLELEPGA